MWSFSTGDPIGVALSAMGLIPGFVPKGDDKVGAYTYIFDISRTFRAE